MVRWERKRNRRWAREHDTPKIKIGLLFLPLTDTEKYRSPGFHLSPSLATEIAPDLGLKGFSLLFKTWNNRGSGQIATFSGVFHSKKYSTGEIGVRSLADFCDCDALLIQHLVKYFAKTPSRAELSQ
ncbi:hypothetical protein V6N13_142232 [Hibiscus sabdariffa]|uniref:Uncharacterized protein n=1 Tax=Hibiscus sabdariffa TaxID=183260 RepID=A0ABR2FDK2_9ROSI